MKYLNVVFKAALLSIVFIACRNTAEIVDIDRIEYLDTVDVYPEPDVKIYQASRERINDLIHTKLEVSFDWDSSFLIGTAELTIKPYFYPTDSLVLDAKGFQINEISLLDKIGKKSSLSYSYDTSQIKIDLNKTYQETDTYKIFIDYIAMPDKFESGGSAAIRSEKGLYFINPKGEEANKPKQIWTQGETESSSRWFPTIDAPNEKTTQEIYMTVDTLYETLSNGKLLFQTENGDGTRTDYWKQELAHAPYLFMMAVGDFAIVQDKWREIDVNYYVEHEYKEYAKDIFPNTPEMIEFFSKQLSYDFPWDKYHQIVVRDYVSGAMENTGAVIFGDFVQGDSRYLIDNSGEDVVAHELFHHWFGDLVTTESWSNLPLNESFATYGEYLWNEHKYGKDAADYGGQTDLKIYLQSSRMDKKKLIRFDYENEMEMFDTHSYQKGGRVLHMLRKYVGDEAFFKAISKYLHDNEFKAAEIHHLRLAFEETTGKDLNWFFNQWFLSAGHPEIEVEKEYVDSLNLFTISIQQNQEGDEIPRVFEIYTDVKIIKSDGKTETHKVHINQREQTFTYEMKERPLGLIFDTDKDILGTIDYDYDNKEAIAIYSNADHYLDKYEAISKLKKSKDQKAFDIIEKGLNDDFWVIRKTAIKSSKNLIKERPQAVYGRLTEIANTDEKSQLRKVAINGLNKYFEDSLTIEFLQIHLKDSSYVVVSQALETMYDIDPEIAVKSAKALENEKSNSLAQTIARIYSEDGSADHLEFFRTKINELESFDKYPFLISYTEYLLKQEELEKLNEGVADIAKVAEESSFWFIRMGAINSLIQIKEANLYVNSTENNEEEVIEKKETEIAKKIDSYLIEIKEKESNSNLIKIIDKELE